MANWQENVVIESGSVLGLACPVSSSNCDNVQWMQVTGQRFINNGLTVYSDLSGKYFVNSTQSNCYLYFKSVDMMSGGSITCTDRGTGLPAKTFHIYVIAAQNPLCQFKDPTRQQARQGEDIVYSCEVMFSGETSGGDVDMQWLTEKKSPTSGQVQKSTDLKSIKLDYQLVAVKAEVPSYICRVSFGNKNSSDALVTRDCAVTSIPVTYPVENVVLNRTGGSNFVPGTNISCIASGYPYPTYKWVKASTEELVAEGQILHVAASGPTQYKCIAMNTVDRVDYKAESLPIMFNNTVNPDDVSSSQSSTWIILVVTLIPLAILLAILIVCLVWSVCPLNKMIKRRRNKMLIVKKNKSSCDDNEPSSLLTSVTPDSQPDVLPRPPQAKPRASVQNIKPMPRPTEPAPKKPPRAEEELLYADLAPDDKPRKARPPRPDPKRNEEAIYTPVIYS